MSVRTGAVWQWVATTGLALAACRHPPPQTGDPIASGARVSDAYGDVIELDQGWTDDTQQAFYNTPQGAQIMPYAWILALEQSDRQTAFLDPANIERYRYLPRKKSSGNPDGLPVGWTKGADDRGGQWLGFTCAACHTAQLEYTAPGADTPLGIRIDGGPTLADFNGLNLAMVAALSATLADPAKFDRFARSVLGAGASPNELSALRGQVEGQTAALDTRNKINQADVAYGFARIDAIGFILNQTMSTLPNIPENAKPSDAPASYPFLWGTDQSDVVQWTGFAANFSGAGVLVRNGGEVVGVYGQVELSSAPRYPSSLMFENLGQLENWVRELNSPQWPAALPAIDQDKARRGEKLFAQACASCHQVIARKHEIKTAYKAVITPIAELGTDPTELDNLDKRTYKAGLFEGKKSAVLTGDVIGATTTGLNPLVNTVTGALLDHAEEAVRAFAAQYATITGRPSASQPGYKARPLNGIWATAPYLHNGSVPNLYELLLPPSQRSTSFVLGSRAFDPVRVGFALDQPTTATAYTPFVFKAGPMSDPQLRGNWNSGHEYLTTPTGVPFTEAQRWELVEYMKTL
jgi:hypothetical protein